MDAETIRGWIARAETEVRDLAEQSEAIQAQLAEARRQLMLLYEMLAASTDAPVGISTEDMRLVRSTRERVLAHAEEVLRSHAKHMRIQDIHAEFVRRGYPLPGRGTPTNIVAHLVADPERFSRPKRGVYGLAEWDKPSHPARADPSATAEQTVTADPERVKLLAGRRARTS